MNAQTTLFLTLFTNKEHPQAIALKKKMDKLHPKIELRMMRVDREEHLSNAVRTDHYKMFFMSNAGLYDKNNTVEELKAVWKLCALNYYLKMFPKVIFLDPTTEIHESLDELETILDEHQAFVVPQRLYPQTTPQYPDEKYFLTAGILHAGCVGFRKSPETIKFVEWWYNRVQLHPEYDVKNGFGSDQLWLTHIFSFLDKVKIIKNPNYNINRANIIERSLEKPITLNFRDVELDRFIEIQPANPNWESLANQYKSSLYKQTLEYFPAYGKVINHYAKPTFLKKTIIWLKKAINFIEIYNHPLLDRKKN